MSMRLYRSLQEHLWDRVPVGLFRLTAETNCRFVSANAHACQFFGFGNFAELLEWDLPRLMVDEQAYLVAMDRLLSTGRLTLHELQIRRKVGDFAWISMTAEVLRDSVGNPLYIDGVFFDVTAHRATALELQRSRAIFDSLGHLSSLGLFLCDPMGVATFSNTTCRDIFGYELERDRDHTMWKNSAHPDDRERAMQSWESSVLARCGCDLMYRFTPPGGTQRLIRVRLAPFFKPGGELDGWVGTAEVVAGLGAG